jgi:hypothetical protein
MYGPRYPWGMDTTPQTTAPVDEDLKRAFDDVSAIKEIKQEFIRYHNFIGERTFRLAQLLLDAETRGVLVEQTLEFAEVSYWLELIDYHHKYLSTILNFGKRPCAKTLRPILEIFGTDRKRVAQEVAALDFQLKHRVERFAKPTDKFVEGVIRKNHTRVLAAYLHIRSDYGGAELANFFEVARSTAYGWLEWFNTLPEGLRDGILAYMDSQVPSMVVCQVPGAGLHEPPPPEGEKAAPPCEPASTAP